MFFTTIILLLYILFNYVFPGQGHRYSTVITIGAVAHTPPLIHTVIINGQPLSMEIDSGASTSIISHQQFKQCFPSVVLHKSKVLLKSVSGPLVNAGEAFVTISHNNQSFNLSFLVCKDTPEFTPLLGRSWLDVLFPQWRNAFVQNVTVSNVNVIPPSIEELKSLFPRPFDPSDTPIEGYFARLTLKLNAKPILAKAYSLAFGLVEAVNRHLDKLVESGKAIRVSRTDWASPGLPVLKKDGSIRFCVDFKKTLNPCLRRDHYPLPRPDDVFANLADGAVFTSLDLKDAYMQLPLHPDSQDLCVVNTHRGFYKLTRLVYGISSAPAIFQSVMDSLLLNIPGVVCYLDNILIKGSCMSECISRTLTVLSRLNRHNVKLRLDKCEWFVEKLEYLGYIISKQGRSPAPELYSTIVQFDSPTSIPMLKYFLGVINFYNQFLPQFATVAKPLRIAASMTSLVWTKACESAFQECKQLLVSNQLLMHYDPKLPIVLCTDASPVGVGAVLCHVVKINGKLVERPIMFASSTLTPTQCNYPQVDREALAIIFGISRFYKYLWGRQFTIVTDCSAVQRILHPSKSLPSRTGSRLQNWASILQGFDYNIVHRKAEEMAVPDALSRLPAKSTLSEYASFNAVLPVDLPLTIDIIAEETRKDPLLSKVFEITFLGWPNGKHSFDNNPDMLPFFKVRDSLSIVSKCLMFGNRVVIPVSLQKRVLDLIHASHPGIVRSKMLARGSVWWPSLNSDIEVLCSHCVPCAKANFKGEPDFVPWTPAKYPFERVHVDFFHFNSLNFLIITDAFSRWLFAHYMPDLTAVSLIKVLSMIFAIFGGVPTCIVSDNGQPFDSAQYVQFCTQLNIIVKRIPPYHASSNGLGERAVQIAKRGLKKLCDEAFKVSAVLPVNDIILKLNQFLLNYQSVPSTSTLKSPSQILLSFPPRTMLSIVNPKVTSQPYAKSHFKENDRVVIRFQVKSIPVEGVVIRQLGESRYLVNISGVAKHVHYNQMSPV